MHRRLWPKRASSSTAVSAETLTRRCAHCSAEIWATIPMFTVTTMTMRTAKLVTPAVTTAAASIAAIDIQKEQLFSPEQLTEIYRCCADSVDGEFFELTDKQEEVIRSVQQQIEVCVPDLNERIRQQEEALERVSQEQTM